MKKYYVYIITNRSNRVLYTGITGNIDKRIYEHKNHLINGFTSKYKLGKLVFFQEFDSPLEAIANEKKIKGWTRSKKINLITNNNPTWKDLSI